MADLSKGPTKNEIEAWLRATEQGIRELQLKLEPLVQEQARLSSRRQLLQDLLGSYDSSTSARQEPENGVPATFADTTGESVRTRTRRQAAEVFREVARPLDTHQLLREFKRRGFEIPGAGRPANITVHLADTDEFFSPRRGMWGLRESAVNSRQRSGTEGPSGFGPPLKT